MIKAFFTEKIEVPVWLVALVALTGLWRLIEAVT
jgi:hypothetical protein